MDACRCIERGNIVRVAAVRFGVSVMGIIPCEIIYGYIYRVDREVKKNG